MESITRMEQASSSKVKDGWVRKFLKRMCENCWSALEDDFRTLLVTFSSSGFSLVLSSYLRTRDGSYL